MSDVGGSESIFASFGVAEHVDALDDFDSLIDRADRALLAAKQAGRGRVVAASSLSDRIAQPSNVGSCNS